MKRRQFLEAAGLAAGGLVLCLDARAGELAVRASGGGAPLGDFLSIESDGTVSFWLTKHEMGQGVSTALAQIVSEELCADWDKVVVRFPLANVERYPDDSNGGHATGGSGTVRSQYDVLRRAGATARQLLVNAAAERWGVPAVQCRAQQHRVLHAKTSRALTFGELAESAARLPLPRNVRLAHDRSFRLIGASKPAKLAPQIVTGQLRYGIDVQMPGLLYALIARCPVFRGRVVRFDASRALRVPGVRHVFGTQPIAGAATAGFPHDIRDGVAVVADSFWAAKRGRAALRIEWDEGENARHDSEDFERWAAERAAQPTDPTGFIGAENAIVDLSRVRKTLRASYVYPHQLHSCMEPLSCTVRVDADRCEVWCGSQAPNLIVSELARVLGLPEVAIEVHLMPSGGGFGRRYYPDFAVEAAFIARRVGGAPVKMMWTREDDQQCNMVHPAQQLEYRAALDGNDRLYAWYEKEVRTYNWGAQHTDPQLSWFAYDIPNIRYDFEDLGARELLQSCAWRGVMHHGRALSECFIDEIAHAVQIDPYDFRLALLTPGRTVEAGYWVPLSSDPLRRVLRYAAEKASYRSPLGPGQGRGIALCPYGDTSCAAVAQVTVRDGKLAIDRVTLAVDCGKVINPSGAIQQLTGGIIWGLTAVLHGGVPIRKGRAVHSNFHENGLLRMDECPSIDVFILPSEDERPRGIGEVSAPLAVPAVLNAIFAATGQRIRRIPIPKGAFAV